MMGLIKSYEVTRTERALELGRFTVSIDELRIALLFGVMVALAMLAYTIGQYDMLEYTRFASFQCNGVIDSTTARVQHCTPSVESSFLVGPHVVWDCREDFRAVQIQGINFTPMPTQK